MDSVYSPASFLHLLPWFRSILRCTQNHQHTPLPPALPYLPKGEIIFSNPVFGMESKFYKSLCTSLFLNFAFMFIQNFLAILRLFSWIPQAEHSKLPRCVAEVCKTFNDAVNDQFKNQFEKHKWPLGSSHNGQFNFKECQRKNLVSSCILPGAAGEVECGTTEGWNP